MKRIVITITIIGTILAIMALTNSDSKTVGAIGDVKYSVLPPDKFKEENGNGWVLMDDKIPLQRSDLNTKHGITFIPDARGLFIRSLNLNRNDDKADPFTKENNRQRLVGEYQKDGIKKHQHNSGVYGPIGFAWGSATDGVSLNTYKAYNPNYPNVKTSDNLESFDETRPQNIALYTYIKINQ